MTTDNGVTGMLRRRLQAGEPLRSAWCVVGEPALAEMLIRSGFDTAVIDMQHGAFSVDTAIRAIVHVALAGAPTIVRVPVGDFATASRMFDAGAAAVIAPMIESAADARAFVAFAKYPPIGQRSWGPQRVVPLTGLAPDAYFEQANALHLALPMIETKAAFAALDEILAVPGVDGVFVGPADLSVALTGGRLDQFGPEVERALDHIAARAKQANKVAGLFCNTGAQALAMQARGFALCSIATDGQLMTTAARAELQPASSDEPRQNAGQPQGGGYS